MPRNTNLRNPCVVSTSWGGQPILYAYQCGIAETLYNDLGIINMLTTAVSTTNLIYKVNNFKPARASKFLDIARGYEGSFCSDAQIPSLRDDEWSITQKKFRAAAGSGKAGSQLYYATVNGLKIGYRVNSSTLPSDFAQVTGLTLANGSDLREIFMGTTFPSLGKAKHIESNQTFAIEPSKFDDLPVTWKPVQQPKYTPQDLYDLMGITP